MSSLHFDPLFLGTRYNLFRFIRHTSEPPLYQVSYVNLIGKNPIDVMVDYTLCYAKMWVISGTRNYGKYDELIKNYKR